MPCERLDVADRFAEALQCLSLNFGAGSSHRNQPPIAVAALYERRIEGLVRHLTEQAPATVNRPPLQNFKLRHYPSCDRVAPALQFHL